MGKNTGQEYIPVGCVLSTLYCMGGLPDRDPPRDRPPEQRPLPPMNRMTNRCKNITLPQTLFAGGKKSGESQGILSVRTSGNHDYVIAI